VCCIDFNLKFPFMLEVLLLADLFVVGWVVGRLYVEYSHVGKKDVDCVFEP
jgi:hypothetical protein